MFSFCRPRGGTWGEINVLLLVRVYGVVALPSGGGWGGPYLVGLFYVVERRVRNTEWMTLRYG